MSLYSGFLRFLLPFSILFVLWRTQLSLAYFPPPSPLFYTLILNFLPFLRFLWVVVFSLVIMTEPYASHDASEIELIRCMCPCALSRRFRPALSERSSKQDKVALLYTDQCNFIITLISYVRSALIWLAPPVLPHKTAWITCVAKVV